MISWRDVLAFFTNPRSIIMGLPDATPAVVEVNDWWKTNAPEFRFEVRMALLGDIEGEDSFRVHDVGDHDKAFGPFQHHWVPRGEAIFHGCGVDVRTASMTACLRGALWEMRNLEHASYRALLAATTIEEAVHALVVKYERSASQATDVVKRTAYAKKWAGIFLDEYVAPEPPPAA